MIAVRGRPCRRYEHQNNVPHTPAFCGSQGERRRARKFCPYGLEGEPAGDFHLFRLDVTELVVVGLNEARDRMVIESWHEGRGVERRERT